MRISELFKLGKTQYELDFVDIDTDYDTPLFLDPYFISRQEFPFAECAYRTLKSFFDYLLFLLRSEKINEAKKVFRYLGETNELCLGLSKGEPSGRGMGPTDSNRIFDSLRKSKAFETGIMEDIEDCRIFVPNVDRDKISDMTANIIKKHLISYTQEQCNLLGIPLKDGITSGYYWDEKAREWTSSYQKMLVIDEKKYILVPKRIVSFSKEYTSEQYYNKFVLCYMQNEHLRMHSSLVKQRADKTEYVTKKDIKELDLKTNKVDKQWLAEFTWKHREIFGEFKSETIRRIQPASNEDLSDVGVEDVVSCLKKKLLSIPPGNENAAEYQRVVLGIMELLFYPQLSVPRIEDELHQGRKRVDITFDNCAESGFFYILAQDMPCRIIMVECKNYNVDIKNPELDQLSGRFSQNRGRFGISACRTIDGIDTCLSRCADTFNDGRGLIIPLTDSDFISMLDGYMRDGSERCEEILHERYHRIAMR